MKITLTKKGRILAFVFLGLIILGSAGFLIWRVLQKETVAPEDSDAGTVGLTRVVGNCYNEKLAGSGDSGEKLWGYIATSEYSFNRLPTTIGPIPEGGEIVLYYKNLETATLVPSLTFTYKDDSNTDQTKTIQVSNLDSNGRAKINTGIVVPPNGEVTLTAVYDPKSALGWEGVNEGGTCGSGLLKGATGGVRDGAYSKKSVASDITWAQSDSNNHILSTQCWADSPEWRYDCDFEDYFLQIAYIPAEAEQCDGTWAAKPEGEYDYCEGIQPSVTISDTVKADTISVLLNGEPQTECAAGEADNCYTALEDGTNTSIDLYLNQETCIDPGDYNLEISWEEEGETESCSLSADFTILPEETSDNPDWVITKTATKNSCIVENSITYARATYNIVIKNIGDGSGTIEQVVDRLDSKVLEAYLTNMSNGGSYDSGEITWELNKTILASGSTELSYTVKVPQGKYGTYNNVVTAYPTTGASFSDEENIELSCEINTTVPDTGVFDTVMGRVSLGISFVFLGGLVTQYSKFNYLINTVTEKHRFKQDIRKAKRRRKKLEDRFN
jgi:hypothetical protein